MDDPHLRPFALLILAWVAWVLVVVVLLLRLLGRHLSFLAIRASHTVFHVSVPALHIYPIAGLVVAPSLVYTPPNATVSVEELVLQARWWRKATGIGPQNVLALNDAHDRDPVAHAQQQGAPGKNANFLKRSFYKLRRAWHRSAYTADPTVAKELAPLISLVCVSVRARIVNNSAHFKHVQTVLDMASDARRQGAPHTPTSSTDFDVPVDDLFPDDPAHVHHEPDASSHTHYSASSSEAAVDPAGPKPLQHRVQELVSLRITTGAFYICDMAQSPFVRVVVDSAKIRYRYGAPACPIDISRKCLRLYLSGLKISVADHRAVQAIAHPHEEPFAMSHQGPRTTPIECYAASCMETGNHQGSSHDIGLMRRAVEIVETSLEVVSESRPNIWDARVSSLQAQRVSKKSEASGCDVSLWFLDLLSLPRASSGTSTGRQELDLAWWIYLKRSRKARSLGHESYGASQQGRRNSFSAIISSELSFVVSPAYLELANDVSRRCKERTLGSEYATSVNQNYATAKGVPSGVSVSADINSLWDV